MSRVSLILPTTKGDPCPDALVPSVRSALEGAGNEVEVIISFSPGTLATDREPSGWKAVEAKDPGLASSAMAGLEAATGEILIVMDARMGYRPETLPAVVEPLRRGEADLVVASRFVKEARAGWFARKVGEFARPFTGSTDPVSGLIGLSRAALDESFPRFLAVGSRYTPEFLSKVHGRRLDVPAEVGETSPRGLPGWDDFRHLKRLADHQYGNASRLIQFCVVGASGMVVDLSCYYVFQKLFNLTSLAEKTLPLGQTSAVTTALAAARASAIAVALVWNFSLNRRLTFSYARKGSILRQFATYVASNLLGVLVSMTLSLGLPERFEFFRQHKLMAAVVGIVAATGISFSMSRWVVFRSAGTDDQAEAETSRDTASATREEAPISGPSHR